MAKLIIANGNIFKRIKNYAELYLQYPQYLQSPRES